MAVLPARSNPRLAKEEATMGSVEPAAGQFEKFLGAEDDGGPIAMINLLRFRERATYEEGSTEQPCSGREAYLRYGAGAGQMVTRYGGEVVTGGAALATVIGPEAEVWDEFVLVRYPSRQAFVEMISDPEYQNVVHHRTAALADSRLIATKPGGLL
jgi:uncharacterized protein (DUF1330 family)